MKKKQIKPPSKFKFRMKEDLIQCDDIFLMFDLRKEKHNKLISIHKQNVFNGHYLMEYALN